MKKKLQTLKIKTGLLSKLLFHLDAKLAVIYFLKNFLFKQSQSLHTKQYDRVKTVLLRKYPDIIEKYRNSENTGTVIRDSRHIWMIWWQGIDHTTPPRIRKNIGHLKRLMPDWELHLVTKENYQEYVEIPEPVLMLIRGQKLSMTHISDYIRVLLLEKYGGIYIDCNFYPTKSLETIDAHLFYTIRHGLFSDWHVCKGLWTTGFLAAGRQNVLFSFMKDMYNRFFTDYPFVPSYFFIDAIIAIGYENIPAIQTEIDQVPMNNRRYNFINENGNEPFDQTIWDEATKDTFLFNANYKYDFNETVNGQETFYGYLYQRD